MLSRRHLLGAGLSAAAGTTLFANAALAAPRVTPASQALASADPIGALLEASNATASPAASGYAYGAPSALASGGREIRRISLLNLHTDERVSAVYWERGRYLTDALAEVNHVLRDYRNGEVHPIDIRLLDLLDDLAAKTGAANGPRDGFKVISAYRSPETNRRMREQSGGVAKNSLHVEGRAMDIRSDALSLSGLHQAAIALGRGGVGYYPRSEFVHVDVGPTRTWRGT